jgi:nucleotide-binding universal stress UspA family protein
MKAFRRSKVIGPEHRALDTSVGPLSPVVSASRAAQYRDSGPVLVGVDGRSNGWDALEWSAAEASARQCALRIVYGTEWCPTPVVEAFGIATVNGWDTGAQESGGRVLHEAINRARQVDPTLRITAHLQMGSAATALLRSACEDSLIVLGRGRGASRHSVSMWSVSRQVVGRARCPVAIGGLFSEPSDGPSAGRVIVALDGTGEPLAPLSFAFRAARRRDVGVTVLHPWNRRSSAELSAQLERAIRICRNTFQDVDV